MPLLSFLQGLVKDQDDANAYCAECGVPFSLLVRRHACGLGCGRSFCSKCTLQVFLLSAPRGEPVAARACVPCASHVVHHSVSNNNNNNNNNNTHKTTTTITQ